MEKHPYAQSYVAKMKDNFYIFLQTCTCPLTQCKEMICSSLRSCTCRLHCPVARSPRGTYPATEKPVPAMINAILHHSLGARSHSSMFKSNIVNSPRLSFLVSTYSTVMLLVKTSLRSLIIITSFR